MKQEIDEIQLLTLSDKGLDNLHKWCNEKDYYINRNNFKIPLLSVGQMIEFLDEHNLIDIHRVGNSIGSGYQWKVQMEPDQFYGDVSFKGYDELCAALFEAVKTILEQ